jgi:hypothetical protein
MLTGGRGYRIPARQQPLTTKKRAGRTRPQERSVVVTIRQVAMRQWAKMLTEIGESSGGPSVVLEGDPAS